MCVNYLRLIINLSFLGRILGKGTLFASVLTDLTSCTTSTPAHLFAIRGSRKGGPGTLQTRD